MSSSRCCRQRCRGFFLGSCGTYGKYSGEEGIRGLWIDLTTFEDYDDFENFCKAIHADEEDPELMFQDYEAFPRKWYDESRFGLCCFEAVKEYSDLCVKYSPDAVDALHNQGCGSAMLKQVWHCVRLALDFIDWGCEELEHFEDCYVGEYDSEEDFARHIVEECYNIEKMMGSLADYFDYERYGRELFMWDYNMGANGNVFRRI